MSARSEVVFSGNQRLHRVRRGKVKAARGSVSTKSDDESISPLLFALHIPLGVLMYDSSLLEILHPIAVFTLGLYWAIQRNTPIVRSAYVAGYIIGVEVLWRMVEAPVYWESGKYGSAVIMIVAILVRQGLSGIPGLPFLYLILLIPACFFPIFSYNWSIGSNMLSFNMSGPVCLFVSCWFFSNIKFSETQIKKLLLYMAMPLLSVAVATLFFTVTNPYLQFTNESNHATSGGFGPNQVSSVLGLGVFLATAGLVLFKNKTVAGAFFAGLALFFAAQSVLTFSRGGIYAAIGAVAAIAIFQARNLVQAIRRFLPVAAIAAVFVFLLFPSLNDFTGGKLEERFESSDTTSRLEIMDQELRVFMENPVFGVGVGQVLVERYLETQHGVSSHTEFTRLISEHGSLGVLAILCLLTASILAIRNQPTGTGKALAAGCMVWAGLCMTNTGMRIAAPAFVWGLSFAVVMGSTNHSRQLLRRTKEKLYRGPVLENASLAGEPGADSRSQGPPQDVNG